MHRPTVGILALVLLAAGMVMLLATEERGEHRDIAAPLLRVGMVLGVLWLALPAMTRPITRWGLVAVLAAVVIFARRPQLFFVALVVLAVAAFLRPRIKALTKPAVGGGESALKKR